MDRQISRRALYAMGLPLGEGATRFAAGMPKTRLICGFGGGGGSSASTNETNNLDNRNTVQTGNATSGSGNTVSVLDAGAIKNSLDFANNALLKSLDFAKGSNSQVVDTLKSSNSQVLDAFKGSASLLAGAYSDAQGRGKSDYIIIAGIAAAALVSYAMIKK